MPTKDFKSGFKANSLKGRKITGEDSTVPFGANPVREELERQAEELPIAEIAITRLFDNPYQYLARPQLDETNLEELASSISQNGFFGALLARRKKNSTDQYELAYGHRRKEAARRAGLLTLPVKIVDLTDTQMVRIMASENFSRQNLDPLGEANVIGLLESNQNLSARQISEIVGQGRSWVERRLALYRAPQDLKEMVAQKPETFSLVDVLISITDNKLRHELTEEVLTNNLSRRQVQERLLRPTPSPSSTSTSLLSSSSPTQNLPYRLPG